ncbi:gliding motility-associated C-terminal domain-containing protein [Bizionia saleffrena]|uniref:Gliding motility-associated C-terminal domain-containing protein n=1 Tax=Bizionia saleffrena TaxID=291189 RepID=A0A8H2QJU1_9FLAO|nr:gliding motility-associated C-terminal domain-containing protein [Bizionia saleffrena]TYB76661.1 gliding motility-associated C-terminal domain-containing protein [Bizionia saleffrena]
MYTNKLNYKSYLLLCFLIFVSQQKVNSQIVIGTPNLGFTQACANADFNTYSTTFVFSPENGLSASNQFSIELSDANGDFSNETTLYTSNAGTITTSPATINFSLPTTTAGENYKIRIKSSAPMATSSSSNSFAAYYKIQDAPFTINNLVSTGVYCLGGSYLLSIDNPGSGNNNSPLNYSQLTFKWYKETGPTTSIFVSNGASLSVNQEGTYFVETNYGTCTSNSFSNRVTVSSVASGETDAGIASSLGNQFCPDQGATTLSTIQGNSYQWYKDGESISGATNQMYDTIESGTYAVQVDLGSCFASGAIAIMSELFESTINVDETNSIEEDESLLVLISSTANNPEFEWYLDTVLIPDATEDNFEATAYGNYKVVVTETMGCLGSREFSFEITKPYDPFPEVENIPNLISPNGDSINDTWMLPAKYVTGTDTHIVIMSNRGEIVLQTTNYLNNWPENDLNLTSINQVFYYIITTSDNEIKKGSITLIK